MLGIWAKHERNRAECYICGRQFAESGCFIPTMTARHLGSYHNKIFELVPARVTRQLLGQLRHRTARKRYARWIRDDDDEAAGTSGSPGRTRATTASDLRSFWQRAQQELPALSDGGLRNPCQARQPPWVRALPRPTREPVRGREGSARSAGPARRLGQTSPSAGT